uniref:IQ motif containing G n=1 Tax=Varanus komodoensis TaxID=61221 RepID=A0A8D2J0H6_VARKO
MPPTFLLLFLVCVHTQPAQSFPAGSPSPLLASAPHWPPGPPFSADGLGTVGTSPVWARRPPRCGPLPSAGGPEAQVQLKPAKLTPLDAVRLSALLEDCTDQLTILGYIMPVSYEGRKDVSNVSASYPLAELVASRCLMAERPPSTCPTCKGHLAPLHLINIAIQQPSVLSGRQQANDVLEDSKDELLTLGTFHTLQLAVSREKDLRAHIQNLIFREEMGRKKIKCLQKQLSDVKKEMDFEVQNRNEMIAYLKDQLQEMKAKTDMESRYVKKDTELQVAQVQKRCSAAENDLQNEIEKLRNQTEQEIRVHLDIESFLKQHIEEKLEYWMEKYEKDTEAKQQALNALKSSRAADQAALQELAKQVGRKAGQAIIEDRKEKERARKKVEQDALEAKSLLKVSWTSL